MVPEAHRKPATPFGPACPSANARLPHPAGDWTDPSKVAKLKQQGGIEQRVFDRILDRKNGSTAWLLRNSTI
jgi:hypothetical protein